MLICGFNFFKDNNPMDESTIVTEVDVNGAPAGDEGGGDAPDFTGEPVSTVGNGGGTDAPQDDGGGDTGGDESGDTTDFTDDGDTGDDTGDNPDGGDDTGEGDDGDTPDFTDDGGGDDMGGEGDAGGGDTGGGAPAGDGSVQADDARGLENEIFADLTPTQIAVKHKELKKNFAAMHEAIDELVERVNEVNAAQYQSAITFVSEQLSDLKEMLADYITDVYSTKSYMENAMNYNRFLATLNGIKEILDEVSSKMGTDDSNSSE